MANNRAFFVTPIGAEGSATRARSDKVLAYILRTALVPDLIEGIDRADQNPNPGEITPTVIASILESTLVIADLTDSNPNVYYEVALAHAYKKPVVHIREATDERLPFDIKDVRVFEYSFDVEAASRATDAIRGAAEHALKDPSSVQTPVGRGTTIAIGATSGDPAAMASADILERLDAIDSRLRDSSITVRADMSKLERRLIELMRDFAEREAAQSLRGDMTPEEKIARRGMRRGIDEALERAISENVSRRRHPAHSSSLDEFRSFEALGIKEQA